MRNGRQVFVVRGVFQYFTDEVILLIHKWEPCLGEISIFWFLALNRERSKSCDRTYSTVTATTKSTTESIFESRILVQSAIYLPDSIASMKNCWGFLLDEEVFNAESAELCDIFEFKKLIYCRIRFWLNIMRLTAHHDCNNKIDCNAIRTEQ